MRRLPPHVVQAIAKHDEEWVRQARGLADALAAARPEDGKDSDDWVRQLRNIQSTAEEGDSWAALALFIRYQAARRQLPVKWAEDAVAQLEQIERDARQLTGSSDPDLIKQVHLEIVSRVLGYTVRWHFWDARKGVKRS